MYCVGDHHGPGLCDCLDARSYVWSVSKHVRTFAGTVTDHYRAGIDTNPDSELGAVGELVEF